MYKLTQAKKVLVEQKESNLLTIADMFKAICSFAEQVAPGKWAI